jgi:hypothetical protein
MLLSSVSLTSTTFFFFYVQDILAALEARTAAAALMRAACSSTASLLVHLSDADPQQQLLGTALENESFLDALICAHTAVVTCREGLQAVIPHPQLSPYISRATDPGLDLLQATSADAAVCAVASRALNSRVLMLLEARQALAVCLRAWQLQGWWPDPVGALMGVQLASSAAVQSFAEQNEDARKAVSRSLVQSGVPVCSKEQEMCCALHWVRAATALPDKTDSPTQHNTHNRPSALVCPAGQSVCASTPCPPSGPPSAAGLPVGPS